MPRRGRRDDWERPEEFGVEVLTRRAFRDDRLEKKGAALIIAYLCSSSLAQAVGEGTPSAHLKAEGEEKNSNLEIRSNFE